MIEQKRSDIEKRGLSSQKIDEILSPKTPTSAVSLKDLNEIAQVVFLRPANRERKDIQNQNDQFLPYTTIKVLRLFRTIGDIHAIYPAKKHYRYIFLNGSTLNNMRHRLRALVELVGTKRLQITPQTEIVFLSGERDLFPDENEAQLMNPGPLRQNPSWKKPSTLPQTEDQAAEWIWAQSDLPQQLRNAKITFVRAKKKTEVNPKTGETVVKRPTTFDTIQTWIHEHHPEPGDCLSISNQPYVYYQKLTIEKAFKKAKLPEKGFSVDGTGFRAEEHRLSKFKENIPVILDNFARTIYTEVHA